MMMMMMARKKQRQREENFQFVQTTSTNCTGLGKFEFWLMFLMGSDAICTPAHSTTIFGLVTVSSCSFFSSRTPRNNTCSMNNLLSPFTIKITRSSATAEKQRVSYACLLGWPKSRPHWRRSRCRLFVDSSVRCRRQKVDSDKKSSHY